MSLHVSQLRIVCAPSYVLSEKNSIKTGTNSPSVKRNPVKQTKEEELKEQTNFFGDRLAFRLGFKIRSRSSRDTRAETAGSILRTRMNGQVHDEENCGKPVRGQRKKERVERILRNELGRS
jgi:hypothetical protein